MKKVLTKIGLEKLQAGLEALKKERNRLIVDLEAARGEGDWTENSALDALKNQLQVLENKQLELEDLIANSRVIKSKNNGDSVGIGSRVSLRINSDQKELEIVSDGQADPLKGQISYGSPLAQALLGRKKGEEVSVAAPSGKITYRILSVNN